VKTFTPSRPSHASTWWRGKTQYGSPSRWPHSTTQCRLPTASGKAAGVLRVHRCILSDRERSPGPGLSAVGDRQCGDLPASTRSWSHGVSATFSRARLVTRRTRSAEPYAPHWPHWPHDAILPRVRAVVCVTVTTVSLWGASAPIPYAQLFFATCHLHVVQRTLG
jgi:hypothetical protein